MHILLIFTFDYSLDMWSKTKILDRELKYFKYINENYPDIKFSILTYGNEKDFEFFDKNQNINIIPAYSIIKYNKSKIFRYIKSIILPFKLKKLIKDIDIIKQFQLHGSWISILIKYLINKPLYIRTGYDMYRFSIYENKNLIKKKLYKYLTFLALKYSDAYSVTSYSDKYFLEEKFKLNKKIEVIPNWVMLGKNKEYNQRFENKVLSVGRLESQKNFYELIALFSNSNIEIDIIGQGSLLKELREIKEKFNSKINFLGKIGFNELQDKYSEYKVFVTTSNYEGNPKTILEAQANGCIVVSLYEENINELIENEKDGFICSRENFLKTVEMILKNNSDAKNISNNAQKKSLRNNSLEFTVLKEIDLLNNLNNFI